MQNIWKAWKKLSLFINNACLHRKIKENRQMRKLKRAQQNQQIQQYMKINVIPMHKEQVRKHLSKN